MIITRTPLRISFAGGGTDLPSFYRKNDYGAVISSSIDKFIYVVLKPHGSLYPEKVRLNYSETEQVDDVDQIRNPIIRECFKFLEIDDRMFVCTVADVPGSSGLGSSSTFCVGLLNALYRYKGVTVSRGRLAEEAAFVEIDVLARPIGKQDHYAAAFGGMNLIKFYSDDTVAVLPVVLNNDTTSIIFSNLLCYWTGIQRSADSILITQNREWKKNNAKLLSMRSDAEHCYELIRSKKLTKKSFAKLVHDGWKKKKTLAPGVSNQWIDGVYEAAIKQGAYGGKLSGAGGGGFLNIFVPRSNIKPVNNTLISNGLVPIKIGPDSDGTIIHVIT